MNTNSVGAFAGEMIRIPQCSLSECFFSPAARLDKDTQWSLVSIDKPLLRVTNKDTVVPAGLSRTLRHDHDPKILEPRSWGRKKVTETGEMSFLPLPVEGSW